ncbi:MAG: hypothetical protein MRY49_03485 [Candidatus Pacebacteria bacterium]|nr:hypothetical protein [Candidatus Paceibacterota bacterium]
MVGKIVGAFNKGISGVHQAAYILAGFTFLSQLLALLRDRLLAHTFGAGSTLDVYYAAFRIPDLVFISAASIVSVSVLVPILSSKFERGGKEGARIFLQSLTTFFLFFIVAVSAILFFLLPYIEPKLFPGFNVEETELLIDLSRIMLLSPILLGLSNIFGGVNQTFQKFFVYALSPILYNLGIILGIVFLEGRFGIVGVVFGVVLGSFMHMLIQIPFVANTGLFSFFSLKVRIKEVLGVIATSLPRTIALGMTHVLLLVFVAVASTMSEGSISIFNFSFNIQSVPLGIIGVSYSLAAFPTLSKLYATGEIEKYVENIINAAKHIIFWSLPITALFIVLRAQIVRVVLGSGSFDWTATRLVAASLALFVISVVFQSLILLFIRAFYVVGKTKIPLLINTVSTVATIILTGTFLIIFKSSMTFRFFVEEILRVENVSGTEVLMLPLSFALGSILNCFLLIYVFRKNFNFLTKDLFVVFYHSFSAGTVSGFIAYFFLPFFVLILDTNTLIGIFLQGLFSGLLGIFFGWILLKILKNRQLTEIEVALSSRWKKLTRVAWSDPDMLS